MKSKYIPLAIVFLALGFVPSVLADTEMNITLTTDEDALLNVDVIANHSEVNINGVDLYDDYERTKDYIDYVDDDKISWRDLFNAFDMDRSEDRLTKNQLNLRRMFFTIFVPRDELFFYFDGIINDMNELWLQQRIIEEKVNYIAEYLELNITALDEKATMKVMIDEGITQLTRNNKTYTYIKESERFLEIIPMD